MKYLVGRIIASGTEIGRKAIEVESGRISNITDVSDLSLSPESCIDFGECYISAGFIDLKLNGAGGAIYQKTRSINELKRILDSVASTGTVYFLPCVLKTDIEEYRLIRNLARDFVKEYPQILGLHYDGPFVNQQLYSLIQRGVQSPAKIDYRDVYYDLTEDMVVFMTFAPEALEPSDALRMIKDGVILSFGHSGASSEQCRAYIDLGVRCCTHLFNDMMPIQGREPGVAGVCLASANVAVTVIIDGNHLANESVNLVWSMKTPDLTCLITNGMPPLNSSLSEFELDGVRIQASGRNGVRREDGKLMGGQEPQLKMIERLVDVTGATVPQAVDTVTRAPAQIIGLERQIGDIRVGHRASFTVFTEGFSPVATILDGTLVWRSD